MSKDGKEAKVSQTINFLMLIVADMTLAFYSSNEMNFT